jgi:hypothetical protein
MLVRARGGPGGQWGIDSPFPSTRSRVRRGLPLILIHPWTFRITFMILLGFTLGSLAVIGRFGSDIRKRIVIVCSVTVIIVSHFTVPIALLVLDGDAWSEGLAMWDGEVRETTAGFPLADVFADSNLDTLVSK